MFITLCAAVEAIESYLNCEKLCCIAAALKAVKLLGHERACVHDVAHSSDEYSSSGRAHIIISFLCCQYKQWRLNRTSIKEETHSSVSRSIHIHPDPACTSAGGSRQAVRKRQRKMVYALVVQVVLHSEIFTHRLNVEFRNE